MGSDGWSESSFLPDLLKRVHRSTLDFFVGFSRRYETDRWRAAHVRQPRAAPRGIWRVLERRTPACWVQHPRWHRPRPLVCSAASCATIRRAGCRWRCRWSSVHLLAAWRARRRGERRGGRSPPPSSSNPRASRRDLGVPRGRTAELSLVPALNLPHGSLSQHAGFDPHGFWEDVDRRGDDPQPPPLVPTRPGRIHGAHTPARPAAAQRGLLDCRTE